VADVRLSMAEYMELLDSIKRANNIKNELVSDVKDLSAVGAKAKKKVSAYNRKYKKAFKKVSGKYRSKSGKWMKNGFKRAVKEAHKVAKK